MAKEILNEDTGLMETFYTQEEQDAIKAEADAKLADKDKHVAEKLLEFQQGKTSAQLKDEEREALVKLAEQKAADALALATSEKEQRVNSVQQFAISQFVGEDPELVQKILGAIPMVNMEIKSDQDILERVRLAANMVGLGNTAVAPTFPAYGGFSPQPKETGVSDADHETFLKEVGLK